jgi:hypothetical protein
VTDTTENLSAGFTGTRFGFTPQQREKLRMLLVDLRPAEVHHGDCVGSDEEFHDLTRELLPETKIVVHPPDKDEHRAHKVGDEERTPKPYLDRDTDIVSESRWLVATPRTTKEIRRSGTWATIRRARRANIAITIIDPDGNARNELPKGPVVRGNLRLMA